MSSVRLSVEPEGRSWAIKHNGGFLGFVKTQQEAVRIADRLADDMRKRGREVELRAPTEATA